MNNFYIVALGNPGQKYFYTRHNVGFLFADYFLNNSKSYNFIEDISLSSNKDYKYYKILLNKIYYKQWLLEYISSSKLDSKIKDIKTVLYILKPLTYMNLSGKAVISFNSKIKNSLPLVIHDDLDLSFGTIKFKQSGASGGHNGLNSIISYLGKNFPRIRVGIGRPKNITGNFGDIVSHYVLSNFTKQELEMLNNVLFPKIADFIWLSWSLGFQYAVGKGIL